MFYSGLNYVGGILTYEVIKKQIILSLSCIDSYYKVDEDNGKG